MELVEVEILTQTITAQYGVLSAGDILRTTPDFAAHLVNDASAARYTSKAPEVEPTEAELQKLAADAAEGKPAKGKAKQ